LLRDERSALTGKSQQRKLVPMPAALGEFPIYPSRRVRLSDRLLSSNAWLSDRVPVCRSSCGDTRFSVHGLPPTSADSGGAVMADMRVHQCQCPGCRGGADYPKRELHQQMNLLLSRLDEQQRRWFAALESKKIGHGGDTLLSLITGLDSNTIRRGRAELDAG